MKSNSDYWDSIFLKIRRITHRRNGYYWDCYIRTHRIFIKRFVSKHRGIFLKTDAFEEAMLDDKTMLPRNRGFRMVIIDISRKVIKYAKTNHKKNFYVICDVSMMPFKDNVFNGILSISTIDNLNSMKRVNLAIDEMIRVLKSNSGWLFLTLDNPYNVLYRIEHQIFWRILPIYRSFMFLDIRILKDILKKRNEVIEIREIGSLFDLPPIFDKIITLGQVVFGLKLSRYILSKIHLLYRVLSSFMVKDKMLCNRFLYFLVKIKK